MGRYTECLCLEKRTLCVSLGQNSQSYSFDNIFFKLFLEQEPGTDGSKHLLDIKSNQPHFFLCFIWGVNLMRLLWNHLCKSSSTWPNLETVQKTDTPSVPFLSSCIGVRMIDGTGKVLSGSWGCPAGTWYRNWHTRSPHIYSVRGIFSLSCFLIGDSDRNRRQ